MEEGKRQKQIAGLLNEEMSNIFQRLGLNMIDAGPQFSAGLLLHLLPGKDSGKILLPAGRGLLLPTK